MTCADCGVELHDARPDRALRGIVIERDGAREPGRDLRRVDGVRKPVVGAIQPISLCRRCGALDADHGKASRR